MLADRTYISKLTCAYACTMQTVCISHLCIRQSVCISHVPLAYFMQTVRISCVHLACIVETVRISRVHLACIVQTVFTSGVHLAGFLQLHTRLTSRACLFKKQGNQLESVIMQRVNHFSPRPNHFTPRTGFSSVAQCVRAGRWRTCCKPNLHSKALSSIHIVNISPFRAW